MENKLNEKDIVLSISDNEFIPVILDNGKIGRIKKCNLYSEATQSYAGLMSPTSFSYSTKKIVSGESRVILKLAFATGKQATLSALVSYMRIEGTLSNLYLLNASHANNGAKAFGINCLSKNNSYGDPVFYYLENNGIITLYCSIHSYHSLTINPLLINNFNIENNFSTLPDDSVIINIS